MAGTPEITPIKSKFGDRLCFVCHRADAKRLRNVPNNPSLQQQLRKYVLMHVEEGHICRSCCNRLDTIQKKVDEFNKDAFSGTLKRCNKDGNSNTLHRTRMKLDYDEYKPASIVALTHTNRTTDVPSFFPIETPKRKAHDIIQNEKQYTLILPKPVAVVPQQKQQVVKQKTSFRSSTASTSCHQADHGYAAEIPPKKVQKKRINRKVTKVFEPKKVTEDLMSLLRQSTERSGYKINEELTRLFADIGQRTKRQMAVKSKDRSILLAGDFNSMRNHSWEKVVEEMTSVYPELTLLLTEIMVGDKTTVTMEKMESLIPKLGMVYSILMKTRYDGFSLVQRVIGCLLSDHVCDQKVYDRLNAVGVSLSYTRMQHAVQPEIARESYQILVEALTAGKFVKLIGDNLDFTQDVRDERANRHKHMVHMFSAAALISEHHFLPWDNPPQTPLSELKAEHVFLSREEYNTLALDMTPMVARILIQYLPQVGGMFKGTIPSHKDPSLVNMCEKTKVVGLETWFLNEQYYQDDVKILENFQALLEKAYGKAGVELTDEDHIPIGGDQLTRERLSIAKSLRLGQTDSRDEFVNLQPVQFEFFHLGMNYLEKLAFSLLWDKNSDPDIGTMKSEATRIMRKNVQEGKPYAANKDFFLSYTNANIAVALCHFFGMENLSEAPSKNIPPQFERDVEKWPWLQATLKKFIDQYAFVGWSDHSTADNIEIDTVDTEEYVDVQLTNGTTLRIQVGSRKEVIVQSKEPDQVYNYGHLALELGLTFKYFVQLCHSPNREKFLPLMKLIMAQWKAQNARAKYPLEILRFLVQQYSLLGENEARQMFMAHFVNTRGKADSFIAADNMMEWIVRANKRQIKHMFAGKTPENINKKSKAMPGIAVIADAFDEDSSTVHHYYGHSTPSAQEDEMKMISDILGVQPFDYNAGRKFRSMKSTVKSMREKFDGHKFVSWFEKKKPTFRP